MAALLSFGGSLREASFNAKLAAAAAREIESVGGASASTIALRDYPMPVYDGDIEAAGFPEQAVALHAAMLGADGFVIASPEYNGSVTAALKNTIDWTSRPIGDHPQLAVYRGKTALLLATSPGGLGGLRGLSHLHTILAGIGVHVFPGQLAVPGAMKAFAEDGSLADEGTAGRLRTLCEGFVSFTNALRGS